MLQRTVVDLDVGTDDAMGLLLLLFGEIAGLIKLEAITCVSGNTEVDNVAKNVVRLLESANRTDIPVYKGAAKELINHEKLPQFHGLDGFGDLDYDTEPDMSILKSEIAAVALGKLITENPGNITIICLGPLTNIALAIKLFPTFMDDVKEIYLMGGNHLGVGNVVPQAEYNFYFDPEAVYITLENTRKLIHILPWETTLKTNITFDWRYNILGAVENPMLELITRAEKSIYDPQPDFWNPCDAFLVGCFLYPEEMITAKVIKNALVELHGSRTRGQMVIDHINTTTPNTVIIENLNVEFFKLLLLEAAKNVLF